MQIGRKQRKSARSASTTVVLVLAVVLAACGADGGSTASTEAADATTAPSDMTAPPDASAPADTSPPGTTVSGETVKVRYTQAGTSLSFANLLYAQSQGYFEEEGLEMEYLPFPPSSGDVVTLLVSGQADVGMAAPSAMYAAVTQDRQLTNYATMQKGPAIGITISSELAAEFEADGVMPDSPVQERLAALEGRTVAGVGTGSATNAMAVMAFEAAGVDPDTGVTFLPVPDHTEAANAVREGQADAMYGALPALLTGQVEGWGVLWLSFPEVEAIGDMPWIEFTASDEFAAEHPEAIEAILRAMWRAAEDFQNDPDAVAQVLKENWYQDMDEDLFQASFEMALPTFTAGLIPSEDGLARSVAVVNAGAEVPIDVSFDQIYDTTAVEATQP